MKRLILLLAIVATSMALSAQSLDYALNLTNEGGKAISNAILFVEIGRTTLALPKLSKGQSTAPHAGRQAQRMVNL